jgi:1,4-alpha-glucan branching enzyme
MTGYFSLILHAHLPFVRHAEHECAYEETWLFEAIIESYLPLIQVLEGWRRDELPVRITLSVSPTLAAMLQDDFLKQRFRRHLAGLIELCQREQCRTTLDASLMPLARNYGRQFLELQELYERWDGDLTLAWKYYSEHGVLELATCAATHAVLPLLEQDEGSVRAQISLARDAHRICFGAAPAGFWLPECAYSYAVDKILKEVGFGWSVVESHGLLSARPRPPRGTFAPVATPSGLAIFGRDFQTAQQVWSRTSGYPGDPRYRDFYRDIAFDLDLDYLAPFLPVAGHRTFTGIKYHCIQDTGHGKGVYQPDDAWAAARDQAHHFCQLVKRQLSMAQAARQPPPVLVAPFDAELFGHWWFEGPVFLDLVAREFLRAEPRLSWITPTDYLRRYGLEAQAIPAASSWGEGGFWRLWLNEKNGWIQPLLRVAQRRMRHLIASHGAANGLAARAIKQAGRELLLAQASDWPFMIHTQAKPDYANRRLEQHLGQFHQLADQLERGNISALDLTACEQVDHIFPFITPAHWRNGKAG